jgi:hypothetical protein
MTYDEYGRYLSHGECTMTQSLDASFALFDVGAGQKPSNPWS